MNSKRDAVPWSNSVIAASVIGGVSALSVGPSFFNVVIFDENTAEHSPADPHGIQVSGAEHTAMAAAFPGMAEVIQQQEAATRELRNTIRELRLEQESLRAERLALQLRDTPQTAPLLAESRPTPSIFTGSIPDRNADGDLSRQEYPGRTAHLTSNTSAAVLYDKAAECFGRRLWHNSIVHVSAAISEDSSDPRFYLLRGLAALHTGQSENAKSDFEAARQCGHMSSSLVAREFQPICCAEDWERILQETREDSSF